LRTVRQGETLGVAGSKIVYGGDDEPGIRRHGRVRVSYTDERAGGRAVSDTETLGRIKRLAVPPAWTDVWISADPSSHIQATGRDARGRKQYRYHREYRTQRDSKKFDQLVPFGHALVPLRRTVDADLDRSGLPKEQVVALIVALLDRTLFRVGNECYARDNGSFGLTTVRDRHARIEGRTIRLRFRGKYAKTCEIAWTDARLARLVQRCRDIPGQILFQWMDDDGGHHPVRSDDVNDYLGQATGMEVTAKTFRTWGATLLAAVGLAAVEDTPARLRPRVLQQAIEVVAGQLGNTPTVCKASYVHPIVLDTFNSGSFGELWHAAPKERTDGLQSEERRLLHVLTEGAAAPVLVAGKQAKDNRSDVPVTVQLEEVRDELDDAVTGFAAKRRAR
jgi:DNA topoisomerase I